MEPENFSTQWGVLWNYTDGVSDYHDVKDRATAERIIKNVREANNGITVELVWRGVTPWIKASI